MSHLAPLKRKPCVQVNLVFWSSFLVFQEPLLRMPLKVEEEATTWILTSRWRETKRPWCGSKTNIWETQASSQELPHRYVIAASNIWGLYQCTDCKNWPWIKYQATESAFPLKSYLVFYFADDDMIWTKLSFIVLHNKEMSGVEGWWCDLILDCGMVRLAALPIWSVHHYGRQCRWPTLKRFCMASSVHPLKPLSVVNNLPHYSLS